MFISPIFKEFLQGYQEDVLLKGKIEKEKINEYTNDEILLKVKSLITLSRIYIITECGNKIFSSDLDSLSSIDNEYIYTKNSNIVEWRSMFNKIKIELGNITPKFKKGDIVKVLSYKIFSTHCGSSESAYTTISRDYYEVLGYSDSDFDGSVRNHFNGRGCVFVKNYYNLIYAIPQEGLKLAPKNISSLEGYEQEKMRLIVSERIMDTQKYALEPIQKDYDEAVKQFSKSYKRLIDHLSIDISKKVDEEVQGMMNMEKFLKNHNKIDYIHFDGQNLVVNTKCLSISISDPEPIIYNIGRYSISLNITLSGDVLAGLKIISIDGCIGNYPHPHVSTGGRPCLGDRITPLKMVYLKSDFVSFMFSIIDFLEHYNPRSPYIGIRDFFRRNKKKFNEVLKIQQEKEEKERQEKQKEEEQATQEDGANSEKTLEDNKELSKKKKKFKVQKIDEYNTEVKTAKDFQEILFEKNGDHDIISTVGKRIVIGENGMIERLDIIQDAGITLGFSDSGEINNGHSPMKAIMDEYTTIPSDYYHLKNPSERTLDEQVRLREYIKNHVIESNIIE